MGMLANLLITLAILLAVLIQPIAILSFLYSWLSLGISLWDSIVYAVVVWLEVLAVACLLAMTGVFITPAKRF